MSRDDRVRSLRDSGDRGAAAVEAAIIFPLLIVLSFGIVEFSLLMRDHVATTSLVRAGARTASSLPRDTALVEATVASMEKAGSALPKDSYEELWIYKANDQGFPGADGNTGFDASDCALGECIRYGWNDSRDSFEPVGGSGWDVTGINACAGDPDADAVGVYLKANHDWITGLFADSTGVSDLAVLNFEPIPTYSTSTPCK